MDEYLSLGSGVQSSTVALMATAGLITPMPTTVLPAPQGRTMTPLPPTTVPPA